MKNTLGVDILLPKKINLILSEYDNFVECITIFEKVVKDSNLELKEINRGQGLDLIQKLDIQSFLIAIDIIGIRLSFNEDLELRDEIIKEIKSSHFSSFYGETPILPHIGADKLVKLLNLKILEHISIFTDSTEKDKKKILKMIQFFCNNFLEKYTEEKDIHLKIEIISERIFFNRIKIIKKVKKRWEKHWKNIDD